MAQQDDRMVKDHIDRLRALEGGIKELGGRMQKVEAITHRLDQDFYNHGRDGLKTKFDSFMIEFRTTEKNRTEFQNKRDDEIKQDLARRHQENTERLEKVSTQISKKTLVWNVAGVFVAIAALVVAILGIYVMVRLSKTTGDLNHLLIGNHHYIYRVSNVVSTIPSLR